MERGILYSPEMVRATRSPGFALTQQCDECPWRLAALPGRFPPERYAALAGSVEQGFAPMFACHKTREGEEQACVGYLAHPESTNNFLVRLALIHKKFDPAWLKLNGPQFENFAAMARANGDEP